MRKHCLVLFSFLIAFFAAAQDLDETITRQIETLETDAENETDNEELQNDFAWLRKHPLNIIEATREQWALFPFVSAIQIEALEKYKQLFGDLISVYELQAVPGWSTDVLSRLRPYITIAKSFSFKNFKSLFKGDHVFRIRNKRIAETKQGYKNVNGYAGSSDQIFLHYRYKVEKFADFGFTMEKDAGEKLFPVRFLPFDFNSVHLLLKPPGKIKTIVLGDYSVNMGQGLIQWQSMGFSKGSLVTNIKREGEVLKAYTGSNEFNFHRGFGMTTQWKKFQVSVFGSGKKLSANFDTTGAVTSISLSGLHRTVSEIENRRRLVYAATGAVIHFRNGSQRTGLNGILHQFGDLINPSSYVYNRYDVSGSRHGNISVDHSITLGNKHFFSELAFDLNKAKGLTAGLLVAADRDVDLAFLIRHIDKRYRAFGGNAFLENGAPENESGIYAGISCRPVQRWQIDAYADYFSFSGLKYGVNAPSKGFDHLVMVSWKPSKSFEAYARFRQKHTLMSDNQAEIPIRDLIAARRKALKIYMHYNMSQITELKVSTESVWVNKGSEPVRNGFLAYVELSSKISRKWSGNMRVAIFQTADYESRIYAYESGLPYSGGIAVFDGSGCRFYLNTKVIISKWMSMAIRFARTVYTDKMVIGSGLEEISGSHRTQVEMQAQCAFQP